MDLKLLPTNYVILTALTFMRVKLITVNISRVLLFKIILYQLKFERWCSGIFTVFHCAGNLLLYKNILFGPEHLYFRYPACQGFQAGDILGWDVPSVLWFHQLQWQLSLDLLCSMKCQ